MLSNIFAIGLLITFCGTCVSENIIVMWKVEPRSSSDSRLSIIPDKSYSDQFRTSENALIIFKGRGRSGSTRTIDDRHVYYWLGEDVTQELAGLTASLAMNKSLERCFGSSFIQREPQGYESQEFRSYFKNAAWSNYRTRGRYNGEISLAVVYEVYDEDKNLSPRVTEDIKLRQPMGSDKLHSEFCTILDTVSEDGIFIRIGRETSGKVRCEAARVAEEMIHEKNYPARTPITVVEEDKEPHAFMKYFVDG